MSLKRALIKQLIRVVLSNFNEDHLFWDKFSSVLLSLYQILVLKIRLLVCKNLKYFVVENIMEVIIH